LIDSKCDADGRDDHEPVGSDVETQQQKPLVISEPDEPDRLTATGSISPRIELHHFSSFAFVSSRNA
jgi:hypothetical protein